MTYKSLSTIITAILFLTLTSCSKNNENPENETGQNLNDGAFLITYGQQIITEELAFEFSVPNEFLNEYFTFFLFYKNSSAEWRWIPDVNLEKNYQLGYSGQYDPEENMGDIILDIKKIDSKEPYSSQLEMKDFRIIGIKTSEISNLPPGEINFRDYNELVKHFRLKE